MTFLNKCASILMITTLALLSANVAAKEYAGIVDNDSYIEFSGVQSKKTSFTGQFKDFDVTAVFDKDNIEQSQIKVTIDLTSVESGSDKRDSMLKKSNWFDVEKTPRSYFNSSSIEAISDGTYLVKGALEINGISRPYSIKLEIRELVDLLQLSGTFTINRLDFDLGLGAWENPDWVKHEVEVKFNIAVMPKG